MILGKLRNRFGKYMLGRLPALTEKRRKNINLDEVQSCLLLGYIESQQDYDDLKWYYSKLKSDYGIFDVDAVFYIDVKEKKLPQYLENESKILILNRDDTNFYGKPNDEKIANLKQEYDLVIMPSRNPAIPLLFINKLTTANTRTARNASWSEPYFDLLLSIREDETARYFAEQLERFLRMINKKTA